MFYHSTSIIMYANCMFVHYKDKYPWINISYPKIVQMCHINEFFFDFMEW